MFVFDEGRHLWSYVLQSYGIWFLQIMRPFYREHNITLNIPRWKTSLLMPNILSPGEQLWSTKALQKRFVKRYPDKGGSLTSTVNIFPPKEKPKIT